MVLHNLKKFPDGYTYRYGELTDLDERDVKALPDIDEAWYWYASAPYEGSGDILMRKGDLYALHCMGHCSCYGPCEQSEPKEWLPLGVLRAKYEPNPEALCDVRELFDAATAAQSA